MDQECALCYEDLSQEHPPVLLDNCCHVFGQQCLDKWTASDNLHRDKCPTCRAVLFNDREPRGNDRQGHQTIPAQLQPVNAVNDFRNIPEDPGDAPNDPFLVLIQPAMRAPRDLNQQTRALYREFLSDLDDVSSFYRKLWRRVVRTLTRQYIASDYRITQELDTAARIMLIELLENIDYEAMYEDDMYELLIQSLDGDDDATFLCRRLMQLVMVMVMLSPLMTMDINVVIGCFELLPDLHSDLGFDVVNTAVADPNAANACLLKFITMLLVDNNIGYVGNNVGAQWYVSGEPSNQFYIKALAVKEKLAVKSRAQTKAFKRMMVVDAEIVELWQQAGSEERRAGQGICARLRRLFQCNDRVRRPRRTL
jgi:hypothetical protein